MDRQRDQYGFTLVELLLVIILVGIVGAVTATRFTDKVDFDARGFTDQTLGMLRYAHKLAIAQRRDVWVQIDQPSGYVCLTYVSVDANCPTANLTAPNQVPDPIDQSWYKRKTPSNVSFTGSTSFRFTALGRLNPNTTQTIVITGGTGGGTIIIEGETGYVR
ncbi:GspH/FimT family pseudopilin [Undibacterium nitidum]|uniref:GspH/FimT family pseudopilin n=1 Tax=Undibacterium TaxID=401469 RepID=UPI002E2FF165|nr:GspH/FimT family pseudopilin [Undibacterium nitidum]